MQASQGGSSSESATVRRDGHFCVAVRAVSELSELLLDYCVGPVSERRITVTTCGVPVENHCRTVGTCCRTIVGLLSDCRALSDSSIGLLSEVTVRDCRSVAQQPHGLDRAAVSAGGRCVATGGARAGSWSGLGSSGERPGAISTSAWHVWRSCSAAGAGCRRAGGARGRY